MDIIKVDHVSKEFNLGQLHTLRRSFGNAMRRWQGLHTAHYPPFKALDDVSFTIRQGEVVGVVGHNGAGKSTLLKLLSRISTPTAGRIQVQGKVSPLIEVGAGLVGDMTGRENIFLNAAILGMAKADVKRKFDEIVAFAEVEDFVDTPVKRFSSGMQAKLGFAVATAVESEILIVDEVLAVGDLAFQKKCFDRMEALIKHGGRTVLIVSHNLRQITRMCSRALLFSRGKLLMDGASSEVCDAFFAQSNEKIAAQSRAGARIEATQEVDLVDVEICDRSGRAVQEVRADEGMVIRVRLKFHEAIESPLVIVGTQTSDLIYLSAAEYRFPAGEMVGPGEVAAEYVTSAFPLRRGSYSVRCSIFDTANRPIFVAEGLKFFNVDDREDELNRPANRLLALGDRVEVRMAGEAIPD